MAESEVRLFMNKAYIFRLYPNSEQKTMLAKTFGCVRFIYNKMLQDRIDYYKETGKSLNNTPAQYKSEFTKKRRKAPCFSYGDIRHVHRICVSN